MLSPLLFVSLSEAKNPFSRSGQTPRRMRMKILTIFILIADQRKVYDEKDKVYFHRASCNCLE